MAAAAEGANELALAGHEQDAFSSDVSCATDAEAVAAEVAVAVVAVAMVAVVATGPGKRSLKATVEASGAL